MLIITAKIFRPRRSLVSQERRHPRAIDHHLGLDLFFASIRSRHRDTAHPAVFRAKNSFCPTADEGGAARLCLLEHHGVKVAPSDLPGRRRLNLPIFVPARDRNEPAARAIDAHSVLHRKVALDHLLFHAETAQKRARLTRHGLADVKARKLFLLENDGLHALFRQEHRGRATGRAAADDKDSCFH